MEEEEFCYIPMGGAMPTIPQRVVGFGGSAGLVHPATGIIYIYMHIYAYIYIYSYINI